MDSNIYKPLVLPCLPFDLILCLLHPMVLFSLANIFLVVSSSSRPSHPCCPPPFGTTSRHPTQLAAARIPPSSAHHTAISFYRWAASVALELASATERFQLHGLSFHATKRAMSHGKESYGAVSSLASVFSIRWVLSSWGHEQLLKGFITPA